MKNGLPHLLYHINSVKFEHKSGIPSLVVVSIDYEQGIALSDVFRR